MELPLDCGTLLPPLQLSTYLQSKPTAVHPHSSFLLRLISPSTRLGLGRVISIWGFDLTRSDSLFLAVYSLAGRQEPSPASVTNITPVRTSLQRLAGLSALFTPEKRGSYPDSIRAKATEGIGSISTIILLPRFNFPFAWHLVT